MKVLMLNYEYPPLGGGTGIACHYLLKEFAEQKNLQLDLLTSSSGNYYEENLSKNIRIVRFNTGKKNSQLHHQNLLMVFSYFIQSTVWVFKHKHDYDLIHAFSGLPGGITAWLSGKPYLVSFRGAEEPGYEPRYDYLLRLFKPILNLIYSQAKFLDANSEYLKQLVLQSFPHLKIKVIHNGVDPTKFYPASKPVTQPIILCTSRLGERKGVEYLIRALPFIPRAKLYLVGTGILEPFLKKLVKQLNLTNRVKFFGQVSHDQLPAIYRQAKIFVLPSLSESYSNALLEAMATGLPVVATNIGGNPEIVNLQNGLLIPSVNSQVLAQAIIKLLNSRFKPKSKSIYSWVDAVKKYFALYLNTN